jgi:hypothetical protein
MAIRPSPPGDVWASVDTRRAISSPSRCRALGPGLEPALRYCCGAEVTRVTVMLSIRRLDSGLQTADYPARLKPMLHEQ